MLDPKAPRFADIPMLAPIAAFACDVSWGFLLKFVAQQKDEEGLDIDPDFQRGHVWTAEQQVRFVEFMLRGGDTARVLYFNCISWDSLSAPRGPYVLVDGKQRLAAATAFLRNELRAFGHLFRDFQDRLRLGHPSFRWHVCALPSRAAVLRWYLDLNDGGVVHTSAELDRVRRLLREETDGQA